MGRSSPNERGSLLSWHPTARPAIVRLALGWCTAGGISPRLRNRSSGCRGRPSRRRSRCLRRRRKESELHVPRLIPTTREGSSRCRDLASPATTPPDCSRQYASRERRLSSMAHAARRRVAGAGRPERVHHSRHHRQLAAQQRHPYVAVIAVDDNRLTALRDALTDIAEAIRSTAPGEHRIVNTLR